MSKPKQVATSDTSSVPGPPPPADKGGWWKSAAAIIGVIGGIIGVLAGAKGLFTTALEQRITSLEQKITKLEEANTSLIQQLERAQSGSGTKLGGDVDRINERIERCVDDINSLKLADQKISSEHDRATEMLSGMRKDLLEWSSDEFGTICDFYEGVYRPDSAICDFHGARRPLKYTPIKFR